MVIKRSRVFIKELANRFGPLPLALAGGLILGLLTLTIPNSLIESLVSATGISELISFAAPPLGIKARIAIALATALLVFGVLALLLVRDGDTQHNDAIANEPAEDLKFASDFEKEARREAALTNSAQVMASNTASLRKPGILERLRGMMPVIGDASPEDVRELEDLPKLRREDRHPDAPPRAPLRAGRDLQDDFDNEALQAANFKDTDGSMNKVANMRKRLGGLIPRDLMGNEDGNMGGTPLVAKRPLETSQAEPKAYAPIAEAPRDFAEDKTVDQTATKQTYAAPPIAEPVMAKPIAVADERDSFYLNDQPEPAKNEEPVSYSDPVSVSQADDFKEKPFKEEAGPEANPEAGPEASPYKAQSEAPALQKFAVVDNAADDEIEPAQTVKHISAPADEVSLNALNLSELIDRLEKGLERLTEHSAHVIAEPVPDNVPMAHSEPSSNDNPSDDQGNISAPEAPAMQTANVQSIAQPIGQKEASFESAKPVENLGEAVQDIAPNIAPEMPKQEPQKADASQPLTDPDDMDEALRAALETLRQMTSQQRNAS